MSAHSPGQGSRLDGGHSRRANSGQIAGILNKAGLSAAQSQKLGKTMGKANAASSYQEKVME